MTIRAAIFRVRARFGRLASNASRAWIEREGIALALSDGEITAMAEAAPLPGVSSDAIDTVARALGAVAWSDIALDGGDPLSIAARVVGDEVPAARFAVEAALLDL